MEASISEYYSARTYKSDALQILYTNGTLPNVTDAVTMTIEGKLGGEVTVMLEMDDVPWSLGGPYTGHFALVETGVYTDPPTWTSAIPVNLRPNSPIVGDFIAECEGTGIGPAFISFSLELWPDGIFHIWQSEEYTSFAVQSYGHHHSIQDWDTYIKTPIMTLKYHVA